MTKLECPKVQINMQWSFYRPSCLLSDKTLFNLGQEFDRSNLYMKFRRSLMKNDKVRSTTIWTERWMDRQTDRPTFVDGP